MYYSKIMWQYIQMWIAMCTFIFFFILCVYKFILRRQNVGLDTSFCSNIPACYFLYMVEDI